MNNITGAEEFIDLTFRPFFSSFLFISVKNAPSAGSQAPAWEPSREAPASRVIGTPGKDLKQSFMGIGSQAGVWEPVEHIKGGTST
jgi:hypothetical protein